MALKKPIELNNSGVSCEYWKIHETNINWHDKVAKITLSGFISQEARENGKNPLVSINYDYTKENFPFLVEENVVAKAYELVKQPKLDEDGVNQNQFTDAEDC